MLGKLKSIFEKWWVGDVTYYEPPIYGLHIERHWTAKAVSACIDFLKKEWKWIVGVLIALAGLYLKSR